MRDDVKYVPVVIDYPSIKQNSSFGLKVDQVLHEGA